MDIQYPGLNLKPVFLFRPMLLTSSNAEFLMRGPGANLSTPTFKEKTPKCSELRISVFVCLFVSAKGLSIYDGLLTMSRLHHFGCFLFRQYLNLISKNISCSVPSSNKRTDQRQSLFKSMFNLL